MRKIRIHGKQNLIKKTLSLLEPLEEDRHEDDNPSTCAGAPNNHNTGIAERLDQNIFGNYEDLVDANIEVSMNFVNTRKTYNRNIIVIQRHIFLYNCSYYLE